MYIHPELAIGVARDHQRRLRAEADAFRQLAQARRNSRISAITAVGLHRSTTAAAHRPGTAAGGHRRSAGATPPVRSRPAGTLAPCEPSVAA